MQCCGVLLGYSMRSGRWARLSGISGILTTLDCITTRTIGMSEGLTSAACTNDAGEVLLQQLHIALRGRFPTRSDREMLVGRKDEQDQACVDGGVVYRAPRCESGRREMTRMTRLYPRVNGAHLRN